MEAELQDLLVKLLSIRNHLQNLQMYYDWKSFVSNISL